MIYICSCETADNGGGVYAYNLTSNGKLQQVKYFACDKPMYAVKCEKGLCVILRNPFLNNENSGYFYIDKSLITASAIIDTKGKCACHLCVDNSNVYVVNYLSGNVVKNGEVVENRKGNSVNSLRQAEPHTHYVGITPDGFLAVCDLGTDNLSFYNNNLRLISQEKSPSGYGIRHLVFSKCGKYVYAINELIPSVSVYEYNSGKARLLNTVKIPCKNKNANGAAIRLNNDGNKLYVSLREENVIIVFNVNDENLVIENTIDAFGDSPRDFNIFNNYLIICNERSKSVIVYNLNNKAVTDEVKIKNALCVI